MIYQIEFEEGVFPDYKKIDKHYHYNDDKIDIEETFFALSDSTTEYGYLRCQALHGGKAVIIHPVISNWSPSLLDSLQEDFGSLLQQYHETLRWYVGGNSFVESQGWVNLLASFIVLRPLNRAYFEMELSYHG